MLIFILTITHSPSRMVAPYTEGLVSSSVPVRGGLNPLLRMAEQMTVTAACLVQVVAWDRLISPSGHVSRSNPPRMVQGMERAKLDKLSVWNQLGDCHPGASRSLSGAQISLETRNGSQVQGVIPPGRCSSLSTVSWARLSAWRPPGVPSRALACLCL